MRAGRSWEDLILSMLAVSQYPIERVVALRERLRKAGLLDPANLADWGVKQVGAELHASGYDRGQLTLMYADRLVSLGKIFKSEGARCETILREGSDDEVRALIAPWHGIGPTVLSTFLNLRRESTAKPGT